MANTRIIPPRVDFLDPRTGKIAHEWFLWLLKVKGNLSDAEILNAFGAVYGVAATAELSKSVDDAALLAQFPFQPADANADIQDVRLLSTPQAQQDFGPEIEAARILSMPRAEHGTNAAKIAARVVLKC